MKRSILIVVFAIMAKLLIAQSDFRPGYYITLEGDTIKGLVDYRGEIRNAKFCVFKSNEQSEEKQFLPNEIQSYRFNEGKYFVSRNIELGKKHKDVERPEESSIVINKEVFLEYLINGITDVYYYKDENGGHYFVQKDGEKLTELLNEQIKKNDPVLGEVIVNTNKHIGVLKAIFSDCNEIQNDINYASLSHKSLINLAEDYHEYVCDSEKCIIYEKRMPSLSFKITPVVGSRYSALHFLRRESLEEYGYLTNISPVFSIGSKIVLPRMSKKLAFDINISFSNESYHGYNEILSDFSNTYENLYLKFMNIGGNFGIQYIYPKGNVRPEFGAGLALKKFIWKESKREKRIVTSTNELFLVEEDMHWQEGSYGNVDQRFASESYGFYFRMGTHFEIKNQPVSLNLLYNLDYGMEDVYTNLMVHSLSLNLSAYF